MYMLNVICTVINVIQQLEELATLRSNTRILSEQQSSIYGQLREERARSEALSIQNRRLEDELKLMSREFGQVESRSYEHNTFHSLLTWRDRLESVDTRKVIGVALVVVLFIFWFVVQ
jgi:hypothetical protein